MTATGKLCTHTHSHTGQLLYPCYLPTAARVMTTKMLSSRPRIKCSETSNNNHHYFLKANIMIFFCPYQQLSPYYNNQAREREYTVTSFVPSDHGLYSPWSSKNLIDQNWLKKFMQVDIDVKYMYTNFGGHGYFDFRDTATLKNGQIFLSDHGLQSMVIKKFN